jgi:hypothetical protein
MRYVLIERTQISANGNASFALAQGLTRGKVSNGGVKGGDRGESGGALGPVFRSFQFTELNQDGLITTCNPIIVTEQNSMWAIERHRLWKM